MSKFFNSKIIEKDSEDITNLQSNLNDLRIGIDDNDIEKSKASPEDSDSSIANCGDLTDIEEEESDVETSYQKGSYTSSENESKWISVEMETLEKFLSGDGIATVENKLEEIFNNILPIDILSADELEKKHPNFPPDFYQYFEQASRKKFEILLKEEFKKTKITNGTFNINF